MFFWEDAMDERVSCSDRFLTPEEIERKSFRILEELLGDFAAPPNEREVVKRIAHATTDVEWAKTFFFSEGAVDAGVAGIRRGVSVVTDVEMVRTGIRTPSSGGSRVFCFLNDPDVVERARGEKTTRARVAIRKALSLFGDATVAIGNAPTALFEVCDLVRSRACRPTLVVGVPIGFVGAAESHRELLSLDCPRITHEGPKGGSPAAAAIVNAIVRIAERAG